MAKKEKQNRKERETVWNVGTKEEISAVVICHDIFTDFIDVDINKYLERGESAIELEGCHFHLSFKPPRLNLDILS